MSGPAAGAKSPQAGAPRPPQPRRPGGRPPGPPPRGGLPRLRITLPERLPLRAVLIAVTALAVLVGGGSWAVYGSSWFRAERVTVGGTVQLTPAQVERAAGVPLGGALVSVDTGTVRKRLLAALPRIKDAEVARSWPHTITVKVTERTASAVLRTGGRFTEVDREGVRFATVGRAPGGVPLVQLTPDQSAGVQHFGTKRLLQAAIAVSADLPQSVHGKATAIRVRSYDGITVELTGGRDVLWGSAEQGARKAAVLSALMTARPHATHYDVSAPTAPAVSGS